MMGSSASSSPPTMSPRPLTVGGSNQPPGTMPGVCLRTNPAESSQTQSALCRPKALTFDLPSTCHIRRRVQWFHGSLGLSKANISNSSGAGAVIPQCPGPESAGQR